MWMVAGPCGAETLPQEKNTLLTHQDARIPGKVRQIPGKVPGKVRQNPNGADDSVRREAGQGIPRRLAGQ